MTQTPEQREAAAFYKWLRSVAHRQDDVGMTARALIRDHCDTCEKADSRAYRAWQQMLKLNTKTRKPATRKQADSKQADDAQAEALPPMSTIDDPK
jgi:hypothetical protein